MSDSAFNPQNINGTTGSGNAVLATSPTLTNPVIGTQSIGDNSTKGASTAYVDRYLPAAAAVVTNQSTTSTTYADLATAGPGVTITTGTKALVFISATMFNNTGAGNTGYMTVAVSGASTVAASDTNSTNGASPGTQFGVPIGRSIIFTGLTAGSNTFTAKYRVDGSTWFYFNRQITVFPLP